MIIALNLMTPSPLAAQEKSTSMCEAGESPKRFLFVDDAFVASRSNLLRTVHPLKQHPGNPLIVQDKPWENEPGLLRYPGVSMWSNPVIWDAAQQRFRMWYWAATAMTMEDKRKLEEAVRTNQGEGDKRQFTTSILCYAESRDGVVWEKPNLDLIRWRDGSKQNNIVLVAPPGPSGENRRFDTPNIIYRPEEPDPNNRFRMITWVDLWLTSENAPRGIHLYRSADGLSWELLKTNAIANAYECNSFFWDQRQGKYIGIVRQIINYNLPRPRRYVCYTESHDFLNWTDAKLVTAPEDMNSPNNLPGDEPYLQASFPYESHYLGFLWTYHVNPRPPSTLSPGAMEVQLRSSLDARHWAFVGEGEYILPNDPPGGYGQGMMSTQSGPPLRVKDELWIYIGLSPVAHAVGAPGPGQQKRVIGLATLRLDGFAALRAGATAGEVVTKALPVNGKSLWVNANADAGTLKAELLDADTGAVIPGYSLANSVAVQTDAVRAKLQWKGLTDLSALAGRSVKIRFSVQNADLYSFWFEHGNDQKRGEL